MIKDNMGKQENFTKKAIETHGDKYDYSKVVYSKTHDPVIIICKKHGEFKQAPVNHFRGQGCPHCARATRKQTKLKKYGDACYNNPEQRKQTNLERYGHENIAQGTKKEKIKQNNLEKYGVEHYTNRAKALETSLEKYGDQFYNNQEQITKTNLDRYGGNPQQNKLVREKTKRTCLDRYGVEYTCKSDEFLKNREFTWNKKYGGHPLATKEVREKIKQTMTERYGCHSKQTDEVKQKYKNTCLAKYGVETALQNEAVQARIVQSNLNNYGVAYYNQKHMAEVLPLLQDYTWLYEQYVELQKTATQIADELGIVDTTVGRYLKHHEIAIKLNYGYSYACITWLESVMETEGIYIQHMLNIGEYRFPEMSRCTADGYCAKTNTIYEFHGDYWHGNPDIYAPNVYNKSLHKSMGELYQKTTDRENKIKELGYNLVVMWESDFNNLIT